MNIPSDEVLAEAAKYANEKCKLRPMAQDVDTARDVITDPTCDSDWSHAVREYVDRVIGPNAFDTYQYSAMSLAIYPGRGTGDLSYPMLGLNGEAGEAAEQWKKALRDDGGKLTEDRRKAVLKELGDVLWYVTACATEAGFSLREVAEANLAKLNDRAARGKLGGSGDER